MKLLSSLLVCCFLLVFTYVCFSQDSISSRETKTFENKCVIDPVVVFDSWELVGYDTVDTIIFGIDFDAFYKNPKEGEIKYVNLMIFPYFLFKTPHGICSLVYLFKDNLIFFNYNQELKKYEESKASAETEETTWLDFEKWFGVKRGKKV